MSSPTNPNMASDLPPIGLRRVVYLQANRAPTVLDSKYRDGSYYEFNTEWRDLSKTPPQVWKLAAINSKIDAVWFLLGPGGGPPASGAVLQFTTSTDGNIVLPDATNGNVNLTAGPGISITGTVGPETVTIGLTGGGPAIEQFTVQAATAPGLTTVSPIANTVVIDGAAVAAHSVPIETRSRALGAYNVEVQRAASSAATDATSQGVTSFNSSHFSVDSNGWTDAVVASAVAPTPANANLAGIAQFNNTQFTVDSHGWVSLVTASPLSTVAIQTFTSTGTYTPTSGMKYCIIELVGGGGGGGGTTTTGVGEITCAGGGAGGGYARKVATAAAIGASQAVTIGAAGTAGAVGGGNGGAGGTTSLGALCIATGGGGGFGGPAVAQNFSSAYGGTAGIGTTGDFLARGNYGVNGTAGLNFASNGGAGGSSFFGGGGQGATTSGGPTNGDAGSNYGGGGGAGATGSGGQTQAAGGAGAKGVVIITEYI